jgi:uncharacterized repeat protein (TIGR01451 family)
LQSLRSTAALTALALAFALGATDAHARGVPAGTPINNTATVDYTVGALTSTVTSNQSSVVVAEIIDVAVTAPTDPVPVSPGATQQILRYRVTNIGNGPETFRLVMSNAITGDQFDPVASSTSIYLDSDGSGAFNSGDAPYVVGTNDPVLAPDGAGSFVYVFVMNDIPATVVDSNVGRSNLTADSRTGTGAAGTVFAGQGASGTDAVIGNTNGIAVGQGEYLVEGVAVAALKSQTVVDQYGGARPIPGATINYSIAVSATGTGTASAAAFTDNVPAGTTYVAGTLRLNSTALSDTADADVGTFESSPQPRVRVQLGNLTAASGTQTITFAVTINSSP